MRVSFSFAWYDMWVGLYHDRQQRTTYICPLPCCVIKVQWKRRGLGSNRLSELEQTARELAGHLTALPVTQCCAELLALKSRNPLLHRAVVTIFRRCCGPWPGTEG